MLVKSVKSVQNASRKVGAACCACCWAVHVHAHEQPIAEHFLSLCCHSRLHELLGVKRNSSAMLARPSGACTVQLPPVPAPVCTPRPPVELLHMPAGPLMPAPSHPPRPSPSSTRQVYMLYELEPAKELTGGPWYGENAFDSEFISVLQEVRGGAGRHAAGHFGYCVDGSTQHTCSVHAKHERLRAVACHALLPIALSCSPLQPSLAFTLPCHAGHHELHQVTRRRHAGRHCSLH